MLHTRRAIFGLILTTISTAAFGAPAANPVLEMKIEKRGVVVIELYPKAAPKTVAHITGLVKRGFYNGILFHRIEPGFVVQAGDPQTKTMGVDAPGIGSGGSGKNIPFETNALTHKVGTLAMARSQSRDSADSQWFINTEQNDRLNGEYVVFGKVTKGMDVVMKIQKGDKIVSIKLKKK